MTFIVTCRVWNGSMRGRGGYAYATHPLEAASISEACSQALNVAKREKWGEVVRIAPVEVAVEVSA